MSQTLASTPAADGFRMPAEYEAHAGCWMLWPERADVWREAARPAQHAFAAVAAAIARFEPVKVGVSREHYDTARALLPETVQVIELSHDDAWMRDVGPSFVTGPGGELRGVHWQFNAWGGLDGGLYFPWDEDGRVGRKVLELEGCARYRAPFVNEGGAVHVDGEGTALVTEECLLNRNRNPQLSRVQIERLLCAYLGARTVIWLGQGLVNDETDGHVDELACFVRPGVVALAWTDRRRDPQHARSRDAWERLKDATDARGRRLEVVRLPLPGPLRMTRREARGLIASESAWPRRPGERLAASYVNFYLSNGGLVMPLLDPRTDAAAARRLKSLFPDRRVVGVPTREVLLGGGNIHCITQQIPAARRRAGQVDPGRRARRGGAAGEGA